MKVVFFGTPEYSVKILDSLKKHFHHLNDGSDIVAVVTQKPKPEGRNQMLAYSPVDTWAHKRRVPIYFSGNDVVKSQIAADVGVLASYGEIISKEAILHFPFGIVNFHPSLLPLWRGASPVQATIISGETLTGGTFMKLDEELDHGPIISQFKDEVLENDTNESLRERLFDRAAEILPNLLDAYLKGKTKTKNQDHDKASYCRQIKKEESFIPGKYLKLALSGKNSKDEWIIPFMKNVNKENYCLVPSARSLDSFIRAMQPWPGAWTEIKLKTNDKQPSSAEASKGKQEKSKKRLKIIKAHFDNSELRTQDSKLVLDEVQLEGKGIVSWSQFIQGYPDSAFI